MIKWRKADVEWSVEVRSKCRANTTVGYYEFRIYNHRGKPHEHGSFYAGDMVEAKAVARKKMKRAARDNAPKQTGGWEKA